MIDVMFGLGILLALAVAFIWHLSRRNLVLKSYLNAAEQRNADLQAVIDRAHDRQLIERNAATASNDDIDAGLDAGGWYRD